MRLRLILLVAALAVVAAACAPPPVLRDPNFLKDTSLITGDPCEAPCWRNIIPGETSWRNAVVLVEDDPQLTNPERQDDQETGARRLNFTDAGGPQCCSIYSADGNTVTSILTLLAPDITLGELIAKHGEPAYLTGDDVTPDQSLVFLIYPDVPMVLYAFAAGRAEGELSASSEIIGAIYVTQEDMDVLMENTDLYTWEGYGRLSTVLDGNFDLTRQPQDS